MSRPSAADMYRRYSESNAAVSSRETPNTAREAYSRSREAAADRLARPPRPGQQVRQRTGPTDDEMAEYDTNLKEMERELEMQEKRDAEQLKEFTGRFGISSLDDSNVSYGDSTVKKILEKAQAEVQQRLARLDEGLQQSFERQMLDMESRYCQHSTDRIRIKSTDVLRINKILREIGRGLGPDWRPVFRIMVKAVPLDVVAKELTKIERQKPFIQAYKALTVARELNGEEFEIFRLVDALKDCDKYDLAERTLDILDSEGDELFTLGTFGRPIVSGSYDTEENGETNGTAEGAPTNGVNDGGDIQGFWDTCRERKPKTLRTPNFVEGPLADRKLLHLSKKMGTCWEQLGAILHVPDEDIQDIKESDADENQTNFKLIWGWREMVLDTVSEEDAVIQLKDAFSQMGRQDLVHMLND